MKSVIGPGMLHSSEKRAHRSKVVGLSGCRLSVETRCHPERQSRDLVGWAATGSCLRASRPPRSLDSARDDNTRENPTRTTDNNRDNQLPATRQPDNPTTRQLDDLTT